MVAVTLFFLPSEILKSKLKKISNSILNEIPDTLDILSSLIRAGLNLDDAVSYYSSNYKGEISQLFKLAQVKIYEGKSRKDAYHDIVKLSFCNEFKTLLIGLPIESETEKILSTNLP